MQSFEGGDSNKPDLPGCRFLDGNGGGTPAFERLIAGGPGEWPSTDDLLAMGAEFLDQ